MNSQGIPSPGIGNCPSPRESFNYGHWLAALILLIYRPGVAQETAREPSLTEQPLGDSPRAAESEPYTFKRGDFRLLLTPTLRLAWNDNVNITNTNPQADLILSPALNANASYPMGNRNLLAVRAIFGFDQYVCHDEYSTWFLESGSQIACELYVKDVRIRFHDQLQYFRDSAREAAIAGSGRYGNMENTAGVQFDWPLRTAGLQLGYDHRIVKSQAEEFESQNRSTDVISGRAGFNLLRDVTAGFEATASLTSYEQQVLNDNSGYTMGLHASWKPSPSITVEPRGGYATYAFENTSRVMRTQDLNSWYADLTVVHQPTTAISYSLSAGREVRLGIQSDIIEDWYIRPAIDWNLFSTASIRSFFAYQHGREGAGSQNGGQVETYDWYRGGVGASYSPTRKLRISLDYRFTVRSSDQEHRGYEQNVVQLTLDYTLQ